MSDTSTAAPDDAGFDPDEKSLARFAPPLSFRLERALDRAVRVLPDVVPGWEEGGPPPSLNTVLNDLVRLGLARALPELRRSLKEAEAELDDYTTYVRWFLDHPGDEEIQAAGLPEGSARERLEREGDERSTSPVVSSPGDYPLTLQRFEAFSRVSIVQRRVTALRTAIEAAREAGGDPDRPAFLAEEA